MRADRLDICLDARTAAAPTPSLPSQLRSGLFKFASRLCSAFAQGCRAKFDKSALIRQRSAYVIHELLELKFDALKTEIIITLFKKRR